MIPLMRRATSISVKALLVGLALLRVMSLNPQSGDLASWTFLRFWLSRGTTLYTGVWDHKDVGYYWLYQPAFQIAGQLGLYIAASLALIFLGVGTYLLAKELAPRSYASWAAIFSIFLFAWSPVYYSTYVEPLALGLTVLGAGMTLRHPLSAGVVFALAVSVKISMIISVGLVLAVLMAAKPRGHSRVLALISTLAAGSLAVVSISYVRSETLGWLEVTRFNSAYANYRRVGFFQDIADPLPIAIVKSAGVYTALYLLLLVSLLVSFRLLERGLPPRLQVRGAAPQPVLQVAFALIAASVLQLVLQVPPSPHHYQLLSGPLCVLAGLLLSRLLPQREGPAVGLAVLSACLLMLLPVFGEDRSTAPAFLLPSQLNRSLEPDSLEINELARLANSSDIAFVGFNGNRLISTENLPPNLTLSCRHFMAFEHVLDSYYPEIRSCIQASDYVLFQILDSTSLSLYRDLVRNLGELGFKDCSLSSDGLRLIASASFECPN